MLLQAADLDNNLDFIEGCIFAADHMSNSRKCMFIFGGYNPLGIIKSGFDKGLLGELYKLDLMDLEVIQKCVLN